MYNIHRCFKFSRSGSDSLDSGVVICHIGRSVDKTRQSCNVGRISEIVERDALVGENVRQGQGQVQGITERWIQGPMPQLW
jgi:hypothetical protein